VLLGVPLIPQKLRVHLHQNYTKFNKDWNSARFELLANISLLKTFADSNHVTAAIVKAIFTGCTTSSTHNLLEYQVWLVYWMPA
jgi:hypothetical protein